jgi:hypothetical protein
MLRVIGYRARNYWAPSIPDSCYLIAVDDDVRYKPTFLEGVVEVQKRNKHSSFSYYTYSLDGLTVGQGCDGLSFWSLMLIVAEPLEFIIRKLRNVCR